MAAAAAAQQQAMAAALQGHDRLRRSTEMPLFYGRKDKDTISARLFIDCIETAAQVANWDDARKLSEIYLVLRDRAVLWWNSLLDADVDRNNYAAVKADFLASYEPRYTAKTTCTNFQELVQRQGEAVHDYYLRVHDSFAKMCEAKPINIGTVRIVPAAAAAVPAADLTTMKTEGIRDTEKFFKHQLFLAGLNEMLRIKVMEANKDTLHESMRLAVELETINQDRRSARGQVSAVEKVDTIEDEIEDDLQDDEIAAINAIRFRNGKPPFKRNFRKKFSANNNGSNKSPNTVICRYCKKPGHVQKDCRKRLRENGAMVDAGGKPFEKRVNVTQTEASSKVENEEMMKRANNVGSIVSGALNSLNW